MQFSRQEVERWLSLSKTDFVKRWYSELYEDTSYSGLKGIFQSYSHKSLEMHFREDKYFSRVIELGANKGEHTKYIRHGFENYELTDLYSISELNELRNGETDTRRLHRFIDAELIQVADSTTDRVLHMCLLHHLKNPENALNEMLRIVKPGGWVSIYLPTDPTFTYRFLKGLSSCGSIKFRGIHKLKKLMDARDHPNHFFGLKVLIRHTFRGSRIIEKRLPFGRFGPCIWMVFQIQIEK